tara:strand:+ start:115 stop:1047 length:933 start_codon:yes stop_codon:yes gene_type:complete
MNDHNKKSVLLVGASGMAGQAFTKYLKSNNLKVIGLSRRGPDIFADFRDNNKNIIEQILTINPEIIINCAAIVSIAYCEENPEEAYKINSLLPKTLASICSLIGSRLIHISTDHYYYGDGKALHSEEDSINLRNKYAETKYKGELNALKYEKSLVLRTNITGFRGDKSSPTFIEWLIDSLLYRKQLKLFYDFYTSTIDVESFCKICMDSTLIKTTGVLNIAASFSTSKKEFAYKLSETMGIDLNWAEDSSITSLETERADSLGLDCSKAEAILTRKMPSPDEVIRNLVIQSRLKNNFKLKRSDCDRILFR